MTTSPTSRRSGPPGVRPKPQMRLTPPLEDLPKLVPSQYGTTAKLFLIRPTTYPVSHVLVVSIQVLLCDRTSSPPSSPSRPTGLSYTWSLCRLTGLRPHRGAESPLPRTSVVPPPVSQLGEGPVSDPDTGTGLGVLRDIYPGINPFPKNGHTDSIPRVLLH